MTSTHMNDWTDFEKALSVEHFLLFCSKGAWCNVKKFRQMFSAYHDALCPSFPPEPTTFFKERPSFFEVYQTTGKDEMTFVMSKRYLAHLQETVLKGQDSVKLRLKYVVKSSDRVKKGHFQHLYQKLYEERNLAFYREYKCPSFVAMVQKCNASMINGKFIYLHQAPASFSRLESPFNPYEYLASSGGLPTLEREFQLELDAKGLSGRGKSTKDQEKFEKAITKLRGYLGMKEGGLDELAGFVWENLDWKSTIESILTKLKNHPQFTTIIKVIEQKPPPKVATTVPSVTSAPRDDGIIELKKIIAELRKESQANRTPVVTDIQSKFGPRAIAHMNESMSWFKGDWTDELNLHVWEFMGPHRRRF